MGFFKEEMADMVEVYQMETVQLYNELEQILMEVEQRKAFVPDDIHHIFRIVHTLKSSSAMMGLTEIQECAHKIENLFQSYREQNKVEEGQYNNVLVLLYKFLEYQQSEMSRIMDSDYYPLSASKIKGQIAQMSQNNISNKEVKRLHVRLKEDCSMKTVRAFLISRNIEKYGIVQKMKPDDLEDEHASEYIAREGMILEVESDCFASILEVIRRDTEVEQVEVVPDIEKTEPGEQQNAEEVQKEPREAGQNQLASVKWNEIQNLQECIGELVIAYSTFQETFKDMGHSKKVEQFATSYEHILRNLDRITNAITMMSFHSITPQFYRIIRDIATKEGKEVELQIQGDEIEVDKQLLDSLNKPFIHIFRNAVDHGIESAAERVKKGKDKTGKLLFRVEKDNNIIMISIKDDGKGMDTEYILQKAADKGLLIKDAEEYTKAEILDFVLRPGFSTNRQANEFSGRGVGMDVVHDTIEELGGTLEIWSVMDEGTRITMKVPVSMTSIDSFRLQIGNYLYLLPIRNVSYIYDHEEAKITVTENQQYVFHEGKMIPLVQLDEEKHQAEQTEGYVLILQGLKYTVSIFVDEILGQQMAVEKMLPQLLGKQYRDQNGITGCVIQGNGQIGFMLNADKIYRIYKRKREAYAISKRNG